MISLKASTFLSNRSVSVARRRVSPVKVSVGSNGRANERNGGVLVESPLKEIEEVASVVEVESDFVEEVQELHSQGLLLAEALAEQVSEEDFEKGLIYPPFKNIRKISAHIAARVAEKAYELGLATCLPQPNDLVKHAENCMYSPTYRNYR